MLMYLLSGKALLLCYCSYCNAMKKVALLRLVFIYSLQMYGEGYFLPVFFGFCFCKLFFVLN